MSKLDVHSTGKVAEPIVEMVICNLAEKRLYGVIGRECAGKGVQYYIWEEGTRVRV
jgi:hypothetical protein